MNAHDANDDRIRAAFDDQRSEDGRARSTYDGVLAREESHRVQLQRSPVLRLAAAIAVTIAAGATYRIGFVQEQKLTVPNEVVALTAWRPETDVLLAAPTKLLQAQTRVRESMIDLDTLTKGVLQ